MSQHPNGISISSAVIAQFARVPTLHRIYTIRYAAEFRRRQPEACRKKIGAPPGQPKFMDAAAAAAVYFSGRRGASENSCS